MRKYGWDHNRVSSATEFLVQSGCISVCNISSDTTEAVYRFEMRNNGKTSSLSA